MYKLVPLSMTVPNELGIYCTSKIKKPKSVRMAQLENRFKGYHTYLRYYNGTSNDLDVMNKEATTIKAFGYGMDCWYYPISTIFLVA